MFGTQEGRDCHDLIEWLAGQDWCNGKVAMRRLLPRHFAMVHRR